MADVSVKIVLPTAVLTASGSKGLSQQRLSGLGTPVTYINLWLIIYQSIFDVNSQNCFLKKMAKV